MINLTKFIFNKKKINKIKNGKIRYLRILTNKIKTKT